MVELQSCAAIDQEESKVENVNVLIAQMADELHTETQRNAKLMEKISFLEAKLLHQKVKDAPLTHELGCSSTLKAVQRSFKRLKRSKEETNNNQNLEKIEKTEHINLEDGLVSWMSMDETQFVHNEKLKKCDNIIDCVDTKESEDEDDYWQINGKSISINDVKQDIYLDPNTSRSGNHSGAENKPTFVHELTKAKGYGKRQESKRDVSEERSEKNETKNNEVYDGTSNIRTSVNEVNNVGFRNVSHQRKPLKLAFCPKEVRGIIESEVLLQKNAQSHTMRKIIVFSCLGIRHGCEEMYELDFNHFSILRKGERFISPQNPGEHVLYENPGARRKIFYPNRNHPTLCPVQILEEEKIMRPLENNCPSSLFLCIKYGGRTRNLPQNEYVRQRMGRNKLKSFGPLICRMAMLANIRSGSFFFKALGITLLFMAGFPNDLVRKETKYRNLDLLQKYYRTDKDAGGEELFLSCSTTDNVYEKQVQEQLTRRTISTKSKGKKQTRTNKHSGSSDKTALPQSSSSTNFAFQSLPSPQPVDSNRRFSNPVVANSCAVTSYQNQNPFNYFPPNAFVPVMYWPPPSSLNPVYTYHSFPTSGNYISFQSQPFCSLPFMPKVMEENAKIENTTEETGSNSDTTSSLEIRT